MVQLNQQLPEKVVNSDGESLEVHSIFYTIQGEGPFSGHPAVFIRLAGCNLQCPKCDTDYTSARQIMSIGEIADSVDSLNVAAELIVITGGEPFRQSIAPLVMTLLNMSYIVQVETNGTLPVPEELIGEPRFTIVCSPKTPRIHPSIREYADAFKYVVSHDSLAVDCLPFTALGLYTSGLVARPNRQVPIYVSPCDEAGRDENVKVCVNAALKHGYTMQIQLHKLLGVE